MRLLVQSQETGRFLVPDMTDGQPCWVRSMKQAGGGVIDSMDTAIQLILDHTEPEDMAHVVDLDRLGTSNDYTEGNSHV